LGLAEVKDESEKDLASDIPEEIGLRKIRLEKIKEAKKVGSMSNTVGSQI